MPGDDPGAGAEGCVEEATLVFSNVPPKRRVARLTPPSTAEAVESVLCSVLSALVLKDSFMVQAALGTRNVEMPDKARGLFAGEQTPRVMVEQSRRIGEASGA